MANTPLPFILYPFATDGDVPVGGIPETGSNSDPVNYQNGWTVPYEYPTTNPSYLPVPRTAFNQVLLDVSSACQQFQWQGVPLYVAPGAGGPAGYLLYSYVAYDAGSGLQIWESQTGTNISPNTSVPGADNNWLPTSGNAQGVATGSIIDFPTFIPPAGHLPAVGQSISRVTYSKLFNAICPTLTCNTTSASTLVTVTSPNGTAGMFVGMYVEGAALKPNSTIASIVNGTQFNLSLTANLTVTGTPVQFFSNGAGANINEFRLPLLNNRACVGADPTKAGLPPESGAVNVYAPGQITGVAQRGIVANNLPAHTHGASATTTLTGQTKDKTGSGSYYVITGSQGATQTGIPGTIAASTTVTVGNNTTTATAFDIVQPSYVSYKMIKYI